MNLQLTYREMAELRIVLADKRHHEFCQLSARSSKTPEQLRPIQEKLYGGDIRLGDNLDADNRVDTMSSMVLFTSILNKLQDLEDEIQNDLGINKEIPDANVSSRN